jgi:hypothetical protein
MHSIGISVVDSLWQTLLIRQGINIETGVVYTNHQTGDQRYSRRDDYAFYASTCALEKQTLGLSKEIGLQGFVKITPGLVIGQSWVRFAFLIFICVCSVVFLVVWFLRKKALLVQRPAITWDVHSHILHYGHEDLLLTGDQVKLFDLLWNNQGRCVSYKDLILSLYGKKTNNAKDNLIQAVKRLRVTLDPVSGLKIETLPGAGYQLSVYFSKG